MLNNSVHLQDAGQKKFGATQCEVCGMVYTLSDPADETMHVKFHQSLLSALRFPVSNTYLNGLCVEIHP